MTTTPTTSPSCGDPAAHPAHDYSDEHGETLCFGVPNRLPSCPDYCDGRHYGHGWDGIDDNGVPWRDDSGGEWEPIRGE